MLESKTPCASPTGHPPASSKMSPSSIPAAAAAARSEELVAATYKRNDQPSMSYKASGGDTGADDMLHSITTTSCPVAADYVTSVHSDATFNLNGG